jgi:hypothetical protein
VKLDREQFIRDAWALEGLPFQHQGTEAEAGGLDCIHTPLYLLRRQGFVTPFEIPRTYQQDSHNCALIEEVLHTYLWKIPQESARASDLYLFKPTFNMRHVGIRLNDSDPPLLLQPSSEPRPGFPHGKITAQPFSDRWIVSFRGVYRLPWLWGDGGACTT